MDRVRTEEVRSLMRQALTAQSDVGRLQERSLTASSGPAAAEWTLAAERAQARVTMAVERISTILATDQRETEERQDRGVRGRVIGYVSG